MIKINVPNFIGSELAELDFKLAGLSYLFQTARAPGERSKSNPHPYEGIAHLLWDLSLRSRRLSELMDLFSGSDLSKDDELEIDWSVTDPIGEIDKQVRDRIARVKG